MPHDHDHQSGFRRNSGNGKWIFIGFLAIAAFFLLTEHRAHLFGFLPWLLILACPLMHLFHGHGEHGGQKDSGAPSRDASSTADDAPPIHDHAGRKS